MNELVRNAIPLTLKMDPDEIIPISTGTVTAKDWCELEVRRMRSNGAHVRVEERLGLVWISRDASEVSISD